MMVEWRRCEMYSITETTNIDGRHRRRRRRHHRRRSRHRRRRRRRRHRRRRRNLFIVLKRARPCNKRIRPVTFKACVGRGHSTAVRTLL